MNRHHPQFTRFASFVSLAVVISSAACDSNKISSAAGPAFAINPCNTSGTLTLDVAKTATVDCSAGGT
ncbi:MAG TPA: hypothetical protein VGQ30_11070, partial [Gemmatimonadaceae bacterium]|nr:hypothetical protein [Gemmatimonadaceae bacterium]